MNQATVTDSRDFQIYLIIDLTEDAWYVGSAWGRSAHDRFGDHMQKSGIHSGAKRITERVNLNHQFTHLVVSEGHGKWADALEREEWWIQHMLIIAPDRGRMNIQLRPTKAPRVPMSEETRARRSQELKGKPRPGGTPWLIGRSPSTKGKKMPNISASKMGHETSDYCRSVLTVLAQTRQTCDECGLVTNNGAMAHHHISSGHIGKHLTTMDEMPSDTPRPLKTRQPWFRCDGCGLETSAAGVAAHQRAAKHVHGIA